MKKYRLKIQAIAERMMSLFNNKPYIVTDYENKFI